MIYTPDDNLSYTSITHEEGPSGHCLAPWRLGWWSAVRASWQEARKLCTFRPESPAHRP